MTLLTRIILVLLYGLLVPLRLVDWVLRRDPLQLREPANVESFWLERRGAEPGSAAYFSEDSTVEGRTTVYLGSPRKVGRGVGRLLTPVFLFLARLNAPRSAQNQEETAAHRAGGQQDIPDEIYTLW